MATSAAEEWTHAAALERGAILTFSPCPFRLPTATDLAFLRDQRPTGGFHKDIVLDPHGAILTGYRARSPAQADRLRSALDAFSAGATAWLADQFPRYARAWRPDRVCFRAEEEA